uniref:Uncharacterized protein n=1 Tax=Oryza punctata TaxID=4537 RepID=A0A0E0KLT9_ORYPU
MAAWCVVGCSLPSPPPAPRIARRAFVLRSSALAAIFHFSGTKPRYLGVHNTSPPSLALNYNPKDGRITKHEAMNQLIQVVTQTKPDNFTPRLVEKTDDYVRVEYESPIFGFVDDVEFWFPPGNKSIVQYRSASRSGFIDFNANKKRVKARTHPPNIDHFYLYIIVFIHVSCILSIFQLLQALRLALENKGWASESPI